MLLPCTDTPFLRLNASISAFFSPPQIMPAIRCFKQSDVNPASTAEGNVPGSQVPYWLSPPSPFHRRFLALVRTFHLLSSVFGGIHGRVWTLSTPNTCSAKPP